jgi:HD-like signal output (HDOD) protein
MNKSKRNIVSDTEAKVCKNCQRVYSSDQDFLTGTSRWRMCSSKNLWFNCACGSTLLLKKGKFPWYSPTQGMSESAASIFNSLNDKKQLPYIKSSILELQDLLAQKEVNEVTVVSALKKDPLLLTEVMLQSERLKLSRGHENPITSLAQAVAYIGFKALSDIVMVAALKTVSTKTKDFDADEFWEESLITAIAAEQVSKKFAPYHKPEELYLAGFLCNIGKLVAAFYFPDKMDKLAQEFKLPRTKGGWLKAEQDHGVIDHRVLGEIACAIWGLPKVVLESVMRHHDVKFEISQKFPVREVVALANQMTHWVKLNPNRIDDDQFKLITKRFKLDDKALDELAEELSQAVKSPSR